MHINIDNVGSDQPLPEEASLMIFNKVVSLFFNFSPEEVSNKPVPTANHGKRSHVLRVIEVTLRVMA